MNIRHTFKSTWLREIDLFPEDLRFLCDHLGIPFILLHPSTTAANENHMIAGWLLLNHDPQLLSVWMIATVLTGPFR